MATTVTVEIDTGGTKDYTSVASAVSDTFSTGSGGGHANGGLTDADMPTNDEELVINQYCTDGNAQTTAPSFNGLTTDATHTVVIDTNSSHRMPGVYQTSGNYVRLEPTNGGFLLQDNYVTIRRFNIKPSISASYVYCFNLDGASNTVIESCIAVSSATASNNPACYVFKNGAAGTIRNSLALNANSSGDGTGWGICSASGANTVTIQNCTIVGCNFGIRRDAQTVNAHNNNVWNCGDAFNGTFSSATYNAYDEGADPGTNGVDTSSYDATDLFLDATNDDYHAVAHSSNPLYEAGDNLYGSGVTIDIDGDARPAAGAFTIGMDEGEPWSTATSTLPVLGFEATATIEESASPISATASFAIPVLDIAADVTVSTPAESITGTAAFSIPTLSVAADVTVANPAGPISATAAFELASFQTQAYATVSNPKPVSTGGAFGVVVHFKPFRRRSLSPLANIDYWYKTR